MSSPFTGLLTVSQVAQKLKLSRARVHKLIAEGRLPASTLIPGNNLMMIRAEDLKLPAVAKRVRTGRPKGPRHHPDQRCA